MFISVKGSSSRIWQTGTYIGLVCIILFAILAGIREEFQPIWLRAVVAGCAFMTLGFGITPKR